MTGLTNVNTNSTLVDDLRYLVLHISSCPYLEFPQEFRYCISNEKGFVDCILKVTCEKELG